MKHNFCELQGESGKTYRFEVFRAAPPAMAGIFVFARPEGDGWVPVYVDECENLAEESTGHEKWGCAQEHGATRILGVGDTDGKSNRKKIVKDLIGEYSPPCND